MLYLNYLHKKMLQPNYKTDRKINLCNTNGLGRFVRGTYASLGVHSNLFVELQNI